MYGGIKMTPQRTDREIAEQIATEFKYQTDEEAVKNIEQALRSARDAALEEAATMIDRELENAPASLSVIKLRLVMERLLSLKSKEGGE